MTVNQILHGDSYEILPTLPDKSFDAVILDPPYGMGIDTWDKHVDVAFFTEHAKRIGREFYAVFGQMPYIAEWHNEAVKAGLHFLEHITWVKRNVTPSKRLNRTHEEVYIYTLNGNKNFYAINGYYEDVKIPGILFSTYDIQSYQRYVADLWKKIETGTHCFRKSSTSHKVYSRLQNSNKHAIAKRYMNFTNVWCFLPENQKKWGENKFHSTAKSLLFLIRLVDLLTPTGGSIIDFFSGSGTTALACQRLKRNFLCIEKEEESWRLSVDRLNHDTFQPELV